LFAVIPIGKGVKLVDRAILPTPLQLIPEPTPPQLPAIWTPPPKLEIVEPIPTAAPAAEPNFDAQACPNSIVLWMDLNFGNSIYMAIDPDSGLWVASPTSTPPYVEFTAGKYFPKKEVFSFCSV